MAPVSVSVESELPRPLISIPCMRETWVSVCSAVRVLLALPLGGIESEVVQKMVGVSVQQSQQKTLPELLSD